MHTCPNCGYCPHCGRSDKPAPMRPGPWPWPSPFHPIHIAPYPGWGGIEVGDRPDLEPTTTCIGTVTQTGQTASRYI